MPPVKKAANAGIWTYGARKRSVRITRTGAKLDCPRACALPLPWLATGLLLVCLTGELRLKYTSPSLRKAPKSNCISDDVRPVGAPGAIGEREPAALGLRARAWRVRRPGYCASAPA